jgi:hypothetical protein
MNTVGEVRFAISALFRDVEAKIDVLHKELVDVSAKLAEANKKLEATKEEKKK